ncbi:MAG: hypothetical protein ACLFP6_03705 [Spirochaetaceae bacterium]
MARRGCRDCPAEETEQPTLRDDPERGLSYHYDRGEREALRRKPIPDHRGSRPFRGNRSLIILTIDVLIVLILGGIYFVFLRGDPGSVTLDGYQFQLRARSFEDGVLISLTVRAEEIRALAGEPFRIRLLEPEPRRLSGELSEDSPLSRDADRLLQGEWLYDLLPEEEGDERSVQLFVPAGAGEEEWSVEVGWGEATGVVDASLTR